MWYWIGGRDLVDVPAALASEERAEVEVERRRVGMTVI